MPWCFALHYVNYEMSNFELTQLLLPWSICCVENKIEEMMWRPLWTTYPKLRNLAMNGFAELANVQKKMQMLQGSLLCTALCVCHENCHRD